MLTKLQLKGILQYNCNTGEFIWISKRPGVTVGSIAGGCDSKGYWKTRIDGVVYYNHHLAWLYTYGYIPKLIDHKDRNPSNNRLDNLRETSRTVNSYNAKLRSDNTTGCRGVTTNRINGTWVATIIIHKKYHYIGTFYSKEDAIKARKEYENKFKNIIF